MLVDFRSDTATRPSAAMYAAMQSATLGDDCKHEDPSVTQLEQEVADLLGKETGLFFPSGTQSNCTALLTHCRSGDELITGENLPCIQIRRRWSFRLRRNFIPPPAP